MDNIFAKILPKKNQWMILLLIGLLLVVIAIPTGTASSGMDNSYASEEETRLKQMLERMEGIESAQVMITFRNTNEVEGVVVIVDSAENAVIVQRINEVVHALFDVDSHKIKVMKGNEIK